MSAENLAAVIEEATARITVKSRPIPKPGSDELLVRNHAIAGNPADWKLQDYALFIEKYPTVLGSDVCGQVIAVGADVKLFKPGDRVMGFAAVIYNSNIDHGAWQSYTILREIATSKIPDDMSFEQGSTFPMASATSAIALFECLAIPRSPQTPHDEAASPILLVWGASSAVGHMAIQIARAQGLTVFGTASKRNHAWIQKIGPVTLFDYNDTDVVDQIVAAAKSSGKTIKMAFNAISDDNTYDIVPTVIQKSAGSGKVVLSLPWPENKPEPEGIELLYSAALRAGTTSSELGAWFFNDYLQKAIHSHTIVPSPPIEIVTGGIENTQKVFDQLKAGVSGKKLVMKLPQPN